MAQTPTHSPNTSVDYSSRRFSKSSSHGPSTPRYNQHDDDNVYGNGGAEGTKFGGGAGNLADELADALSDGEDEYYDQDGGAPGINFDLQEEGGRTKEVATRDSGVELESPGLSSKNNLGPPLVNGRDHRRVASDYDGSDYGSETDLESSGMTPSLVAKIDAIESLARRGVGNTGLAADGAFTRVTNGLRDLSPQSVVESGATRLITTHSALTTHINHQTRKLHNLSFAILSPAVLSPDAETIDALLPMLVSLSETTPQPSTNAFHSLAALQSLTSDLLQTLGILSDTLAMSRQDTTQAGRRLRSTKELVSELRREQELREEAVVWLSRGNWDERLAKRECATICSDIVDGFEEVCDRWRLRLLAQGESAPA